MTALVLGLWLGSNAPVRAAEQVKAESKQGAVEQTAVLKEQMAVSLLLSEQDTAKSGSLQTAHVLSARQSSLPKVEKVISEREKLEAEAKAAAEIAARIAREAAEKAAAEKAAREEAERQAALATGETIAQAALAQIGVGQDCTMLATNSLRAVGINFHGWPADYFSLGYTVSAADAKAGDLIYYANGGMGLAHIAVYVGGGQAVHGGWNGGGTVLTTAYLGSGPVFIRVVK